MGVIDVLSNPLEWLVSQMLSAAYESFRALLVFLLVNTEPQLVGSDSAMADAFQGQFAMTIRIGLFITVPLVLAAAMHAMIKGGLKALLHTFVVGLPVSLFGGFAALALAAVAQAVNQNIVDFFDESAHQNMMEFLTTIDGFGEAYAASLGMYVFGGFLALFIVLGTFFLTIELIAREITIYMAMLFIPLAFAAYVWPLTRKWLFSLIELVLVMIFTKSIMVATLSLGFAAVLAGFGTTDAGGDAGANAAVAAMAMGVIIMFVSAFSLPMLVAMALAPNSPAPAGRTELQRANPLYTPKTFTYSVYKKAGTAVVRRPGGGADLSG